MTAKSVRREESSRYKVKPMGPALRVEDGRGYLNAVPVTLRPVGVSTGDGLGAFSSDFAVFKGMSVVGRAQEIRAGFWSEILPRISEELLGIPLQSLLAGLRLPASTIKRKLAESERLSASESDRVARTLMMYFEAEDVFEDAGNAGKWLVHPHVELGGERPLDMLDTQAGYDRVRDLLMRIEYGIGV
jgi:putative toxin-antitoxin system antitoxin component (TIGR02293 family)